MYSPSNGLGKRTIGRKALTYCLISRGELVSQGVWVHSRWATHGLQVHYQLELDKLQYMCGTRPALFFVARSHAFIARASVICVTAQDTHTLICTHVSNTLMRTHVHDTDTSLPMAPNHPVGLEGQFAVQQHVRAGDGTEHIAGVPCT